MAGFLARGARLAAVAMAVAFLGSPIKAGELSDPQKSQIEAVVKDYILKNPEIVRQAIDELADREKAKEAAARSKSLSDVKGALYNSPNESVVGNPQGKITLVEFFDYNCGYCKLMLPKIARLMKTNPDLKVILRDYPVISEASQDAAMIEAAVRQQFQGDKFWEYHQRLLGMHGLVGRQEAADLAQAMGADMPRLARDAQLPGVKAGLDETMKLGRLLSIDGTPSYIVGDKIVEGADEQQLESGIENVKKCGKAICS